METFVTRETNCGRCETTDSVEETATISYVMGELQVKLRTHSKCEACGYVESHEATLAPIGKNDVISGLPF